MTDEDKMKLEECLSIRNELVGKDTGKSVEKGEELIIIGHRYSCYGIFRELTRGSYEKGFSILACDQGWEGEEVLLDDPATHFLRPDQYLLEDSKYHWIVIEYQRRVKRDRTPELALPLRPSTVVYRVEEVENDK